MKFSVPTNWEQDLIPKLRKDNIDEVYGKLAYDFVGGGRASFLIPHVSKKKAAVHIKEIHKNGLSFNYLLNTTCLGNLEWTASGQKKIRRLLDWLVSIGVDKVTVSIPYLLELIKKCYPQLKVAISTQAGIDTVERAMMWENLGADKLTLSVVDVNRNFKLLKRIRESVKCELQLIGNLLCLYRCPFYKYHSALNAHASQPGYRLRGFVIDYCSLRCTTYRLNNPVEFIRSLWIRPEDISYYEGVGIDGIKLVDRGMKTESIALIVNAYLARRHDGNLLDLMPHATKNIMFQDSKPWHKLRYFFRPLLVNIFRLQKGRGLFSSANIYIDNRKLDGFIEYFLNNDCSLRSCRECSYCKNISKEVLKIDSGHQLRDMEEYISELVSGGMFKYP